jgi:hypothetical protein
MEYVILFLHIICYCLDALRYRTLCPTNIWNPTEWPITYFHLFISNYRNSERKPNKETVFHIAACNLFIQSAKPDNIDFRKARPKERGRNALPEKTVKRFSMYCPGYRYCFMHGVCDIVFTHYLLLFGCLAIMCHLSNKYMESGWMNYCIFPPFYIQLSEFGTETGQRENIELNGRTLL